MEEKDSAAPATAPTEPAPPSPAAPPADAVTGAADTALGAVSDAAPSAAPTRPRGRPRKDGLPPGSPEAKAADATPKGSAGSTPANVAAVERPAAPGVQSNAPEASKVEEAPARSRARKPAPLIPVEVKQQASGTVCTVPYCTAPHPSRGGELGPVCVESGKPIVEPMDAADGRDLCDAVLGGVSSGIGLFSRHEISGPSERELDKITPPVIRMLHRAGIGKGSISVDTLVICLVLMAYMRVRIDEARGKAPARKAA